MTIIEQIKRLRELEAKATPGPWLRSELSLEISSAQKPICIVESNHKREGTCIYREWEPRDNAELIAEIRNALPGILDSLASLSEENASLRDALDLYARTDELRDSEARSILEKRKKS